MLHSEARSAERVNRAPAARGAGAKRPCSAGEARRAKPRPQGRLRPVERERSEPAPQPRREAARRVNRAPAARRTRAKRACPAGGAPSRGAQRQAAGAEPRPSDGRRCSPCRIAGQTRRARRAKPGARRGGYTRARNVPRSGSAVGPSPLSHGPTGLAQPVGRDLPSAGVYASAAAGSARSGASGCGVRDTRCVERSERGYARLGGRRASPGGRASCGERRGMGYTVSHPMDAATPCGLRLRSMGASRPLHGPQAPDSRARRCAPRCGACSLRSRSALRAPRARVSRSWSSLRGAARRRSPLHRSSPAGTPAPRARTRR